MDKVRDMPVYVHQFYGHVWYYPFMTESLKRTIEDAFQKDQDMIMVNRQDLENMFGQFLFRISN
jgi:hypothetical protein